MIERLRARFAGTGLGGVVAVWGCGYILVDIFAVLLGRTVPGANSLSSIPLFFLGIFLSLGLDRLRGFLPERLALRWGLLGLAIAVAAALQSIADISWLRFLALNLPLGWEGWAKISLQRFLIGVLLYAWTFCLSLALLRAAHLVAQAEANAARADRAEAEAERAEAEADEAEAEAERAEDAAERAEAMALRLQLNPHFLFNTLNSISSLVTLDRKEDAQAMIQALGEFLRASLHADPTADVTLAEEIETVDAYLGIECVRFGERLAIEFDVADGLSLVPVPNFILQPLVENAIKHGVATTRGPASLRIEVAHVDGHLVLTVVNTRPEGADAGTASASTGIGLANIRQRLAIRYDEMARLETGPIPDGWRAAIFLPH